jgi:hypothetical protein
MAKKLNVLANAPDFELTDTNGQVQVLSSLWKDEYVVLVLLRGFV